MGIFAWCGAALRGGGAFLFAIDGGAQPAVGLLLRVRLVDEAVDEVIAIGSVNLFNGLVDYCSLRHGFLDFLLRIIGKMHLLLLVRRRLRLLLLAFALLGHRVRFVLFRVFLIGSHLLHLLELGLVQLLLDLVLFFPFDVALLLLAFFGVFLSFFWGHLLHFLLVFFVFFGFVLFFDDLLRGKEVHSVVFGVLLGFLLNEILLLILLCVLGSVLGPHRGLLLGLFLGILLSEDCGGVYLEGIVVRNCIWIFIIVVLQLRGLLVLQLTFVLLL